MNSRNIYNNTSRAESYAKLEFPNTYYLAYRDLPEIISTHAKGKMAIDFGCGTGRSTRFLKKLGFKVIGLDISTKMLRKAMEIDPTGNYQLVSDGNYSHLGVEKYDLVISLFAFDNIPDKKNRAFILEQLATLIKKRGTIILLDSRPEIYFHEWASFSTKAFTDNQKVKSGGKVRIIMTDVEDNTPVEDYLWFHEDYLELFHETKMKLTNTYQPLGKPSDGIAWKMETEIAPWVIYVLRK